MPLLNNGLRAGAVAHRSLDGTQVTLSGELDLSLPFTSVARVSIEGRLHEFTSGVMRFGFELGTGVRTYVSASASYVIALDRIISHLHLGAAVVVGTAFGAGRAVSAIKQYWSRNASWNARCHPTAMDHQRNIDKYSLGDGHYLNVKER
jgi:hypothetical protein